LFYGASKHGTLFGIVSTLSLKKVLTYPYMRPPEVPAGAAKLLLRRSF
jgi:hypothetical protein